MMLRNSFLALALGAAVPAAGAFAQARRTGAVLTDLGGLLLATAAVMAIRDRHLTTRSNTLGIAGAGLLTLSIPAQFIADGHLSQAVWWYNLQFTRR